MALILTQTPHGIIENFPVCVCHHETVHIRPIWGNWDPYEN